MKYDIVIPYDNQNDESLKFALRSINEFVDYNDVYLVSPKKPTWITNVKYIKKDDVHLQNKDANLFDKVFCAIDNGMKENFIFWSDDHLVLKKIDELTPVANNRNPLKMKPKNKWERRLVRTGEFVRDNHKVVLDKNYDAHVPQPMEVSKFELIRNIDYQSGLGFTICTLYFGINKPDKTLHQLSVKATLERDRIEIINIANKTYMGWHDRIFPLIKSYLVKNFSEKSSFEI